MHSLPARASSRSVTRFSFAALVAGSLALGSTAWADGNPHFGDGGDPLDHVFTLDHQVPIGAGHSLHVTEKFSLRAFLRSGPRRAIVMLPGPVTLGSFFNIDVPGYDGGAIMAQHGFFAYAVDYEGSGTSTSPAQGTAVTLESQVEAVKSVLRYVQLAREVPRVDLLGESWGGGIAAEVCKPKYGARSCILASMIYKTPSALAAAEFQSPGWDAFLQSQPNGYLQAPAPLYQQLVADSPPAVQQWTLATQPGLYTVEPLFDFFTLPFFDPDEARVPGLLIQGEDDPQSIPSDIQQLAADYGQHGAVGLVTIAGAGHIPRIESAPHNTQFWSAVTDFVEQ